MNILWIAPSGRKLHVAEAIVTQGHRVVVYSNAITALPRIETHELYPWAANADLIVVDEPFPLLRTRSGSWRPSDESLFVDELRRRYAKIAIGPTPTVDLLVGDPRYLRKWCRRLNIDFVPALDDGWESGAWFRQSEIVPEGPLMKPWSSLFRGVGFRGWFELHGRVEDGDVVVTSADATWADDSIPAGREAEFLKALTR